MSWKHCGVHGRYQSFDGTRGCPDCLQDVEDAREHREQLRGQAERRSEELGRLQEAAEERAAQIEEAQQREEERQREAERSREEALHKQANPGDYQCPGCGFQTLKRGFPRCTRCQWDVAPDYWPGIFEKERKQSEEKARRERVAAEEWAKGEPERTRLAKAAAEASAKAAAERAAAASRAVSAKKWTGFFDGVVKVYFGYLLPILAWKSVQAFGLVAPPGVQVQELTQDVWWLLLPALNWLSYFGLMVFGGPNRPLAWTVFAFWAAAGGVTFWARGAARRL